MNKLTNDKRGFMGLILAVFIGIFVLLIFALIFKKSLMEIFGSFANIYKSRTFWIILILTLIIIFRKFVIEVLMMVLKFVRGILHA